MFLKVPTYARKKLELAWNLENNPFCSFWTNGNGKRKWDGDEYVLLSPNFVMSGGPTKKPSLIEYFTK